MKKIRVLQMFISNNKGGRTKYILDIWKFINKSKFQFDFVTLSAKLDFEQQLKAEGCKVHYVSCYAEDNYEQFVKEIDLILAQAYDVIHIHFGYWISFTVEQRAKAMGIKKIIVHAHSAGIGGGGNQDKIAQLVSRHYLLKEKLTEDLASNFLSCSEESAKWMYGDKISLQKQCILKNGIDIKEYMFNNIVREKIRKEMDLRDKYVLGHIGRFVYEKNHDFLIEVFRIISEQINHAVLMLIGTGELRSTIENKINQYGIQDKVILLERRNDIAQLIQAMDIFLFPSKFEGFGLALLEAEVAGLPCLASNVPQEVILSERAEVLELDIASWVDRILYNYKLNSRVTIDEEIVNKYDIKMVVSKLEEIYMD